MFFSAKQLYESGLVSFWELDDFDGMEKRASLSRIKKYVKACKTAILNREQDVETANDYISVFKWYRPWDVVPELKNFKAPDGEYAIGIEVEASFTDDGRAVAKKIQHWKHVAVDFEASDDMMEVTFPPMLYNKLSSKQQPFRYLKLLRSDSTVVDHDEDDEIGIHVNVSKGGHLPDTARTHTLGEMLRSHLSGAECRKYFGRARSYGYGHAYNRDYIEFKLFNSTTDSKVLRKYIHVAVALADIIYSDVDITEEVVLAALETAHSKR